MEIYIHRVDGDKRGQDDAGAALTMAELASSATGSRASAGVAASSNDGALTAASLTGQWMPWP